VLALEAKTKQDQSQTKVTYSMFPLIQLVLLLLLLTALTKLRSKLACCPRPSQRIDQESGSRLGRPARQGSGIHRRPSEHSHSQTRRRIHLTLSSLPKSTRTRTLKATGIRDQHTVAWLLLRSVRPPAGVSEGCVWPVSGEGVGGHQSRTPPHYRKQRLDGGRAALAAHPQRTQSPSKPQSQPSPSPVPVPTLPRTLQRPHPSREPRGDVRMPILAKPVLVE